MCARARTGTAWAMINHKLSCQVSSELGKCSQATTLHRQTRPAYATLDIHWEFWVFHGDGISSWVLHPEDGGSMIFWNVGILPEQYESVSKSFGTGGPEREQQMVHISANRCSCIAISWVSLMSFTATTLCVAFQRVFIVVVYFVTGSVRKLLDTTSYTASQPRRPRLHTN
jgi:hypothetical protein